MAKGKLFFVTGLFGAGKTTLTSVAVNAIKNLDYLVSYTTRPKRANEISGEGEFIFVDTQEYLEIKSQCKKWDETVIRDNYYGIDVENIDRQLQAGINLIFCIAPEVKVIDQMSHMYAVKPVLIWIDTDLETSNQRLVEGGRSERINDAMQTEERVEEIRKISNTVFTPTLNLEEDKINFINLIQQLITSD